MSALPTELQLPRPQIPKVDLTNGAWFKLTLPGLIAALITAYGVVRYMDGIEARLSQHDASILLLHDTQKEIVVTLNRAIEAVAKIEGRLQNRP